MTPSRRAQPRVAVVGVRAVLQRGLALAGLWWVLAEGRTDDWGVALVSVLLALLASLWLSPPGPSRVPFSDLLRFAGFFLAQSVRSGAMVASLALRRRLDLAPTVLEFPVELPPGPARVLLIYTLSLLPGTLTVRLDDSLLRVHVLDTRLHVEVEIDAAQRHIGRLLRVAP